MKEEIKVKMGMGMGMEAEMRPRALPSPAEWPFVVPPLYHHHD